jgi:hypothetical protein
VMVVVCQNSGKRGLFGASATFFERFMRENSPRRPENRCYLNNILIL